MNRSISIPSLFNSQVLFTLLHKTTVKLLLPRGQGSPNFQSTGRLAVLTLLHSAPWMPPSYNGFSLGLFPCLLLIALAPPFLCLLIVPNIYLQTTLLTPQTFPGQSFQPPSCYMLTIPKCNTISTPISPQNSFYLLEIFQNITFSSPKSKTHTHPQNPP